VLKQKLLMSQTMPKKLILFIGIEPTEGVSGDFVGGNNQSV
jgi:hypothetical protein